MMSTGTGAAAAVDWLLRGLAVLSAATCLVWILGATGTGFLYDGPQPVNDAVRSFDLPAAAGSPTMPVQGGAEVVQQVLRAGPFTSGDGSDPGAFAELTFTLHATTYDPTPGQRVAYVGLQCLASLALAWLWWSLAGVVRASRRGDPFTVAQASRLRMLGLLVAIGGPAYVVAMWLVHRWLLATSELADVATVGALHWRSVPWWTVGVGLVLLVMAGVWRRGAAMRHDLAGLV